MKITKESTPENTIHSSQSFTIDLNGGLSVVATAYINAEILNTRGKIAEFEVCDVETEFYIGGKKCKYAGFKELYTQVFGENSMKQLEDDVHDFVQKRVLEHGSVMGYQSVSTLCAPDIMDVIMENIQDHFVEWNGLLYTSDYLTMQLVREYNKQVASARYIDTYTSDQVPPSWRVKKEGGELEEWRPQNYKVNYIKLRVTERDCGKISKVQPIRR